MQDYLSQNPESVHQVMILFSDRGTPNGYHREHGYSGHTFKWVNANGEFVYVQVHVRADGGFKTLTDGEALMGATIAAIKLLRYLLLTHPSDKGT